MARHLRRQVTGPVLRTKLVPDYPIGAKCVLFNDDHYPALKRRNVCLVRTPIERFGGVGVRTTDGAHHAADVITYATGFKVARILAQMTVTGLSGRDLQDE